MDFVSDRNADVIAGCVYRSGAKVSYAKELLLRCVWNRALRNKAWFAAIDWNAPDC